MCIYSPMPHTLSYCALIGKCALIRSNTVFFIVLGLFEPLQFSPKCNLNPFLKALYSNKKKIPKMTHKLSQGEFRFSSWIWLIHASKHKRSFLRKPHLSQDTRPRGYKFFFVLNSTEYEIFPARNCQNVNIYEREK